MNCPIDGTTLLMSERQGIEIDYCPQCRGIWLDRGELEKLIERGSQMQRGVQPSSGVVYDTDHDDYMEKRKTSEMDPQHPHKRKRGFLDDIFDIFD